MNPVELTFRTVHAQAVAGARQVREEMNRVGTTARQTGREQVASSRQVRSAREQEARATVASSVRERRALTEQLAAYRQVASQARRGSEAQVQANRLAAESAHRLGVEMRLQERHAAGARGELGKLSRGAVAGSGVFRSLGRQVAFASGAFLGAVGFIGVVRSAISAAGDLETQVARSEIVFGDSAKGVQEWARTTYQSLGIAEGAALGFANSFGTILTAMGEAPAVAAETAKELTKVAAAISLARGEEDPRRATQALMVALAGRGRALRQYGIIIDQVTLKAEAMRLGLLKSAASDAEVELAQRKLAEASAVLADTESKHTANSVAVARAQDAVTAAHARLQKVVSGSTATLSKEVQAEAAASLVRRQGARFVQNYGNLMNTAAGRSRRFHQGVQQLDEELGRALLPAFTRIIREINKWIASVTEGGKKHKELVRDLRQLRSGVNETFRAVRLLARGLNAVVSAAGGWGNAFKIILSLVLAQRFLRLVAAIKESRTAMILFGRTSAATATAVEGEAVAMGAAMKAAFATTILGAAILAAILIIQHWKQVKAFFQLLWVALKIDALVAYKAILEPFSHLPGRLGGWARDAKVGVETQLSQLAVDAARYGNATGINWGQAAAAGMQAAGWELRNGVWYAKTGTPHGKSIGQIAKEMGLPPRPRLGHPPAPAPPPSSSGGDLAGDGGGFVADHPKSHKSKKPDYSQGLAIAKAAETQLGVPYVWGGTRWNVGLDCSGLAQGALRQVGISIPRTSQEQWAQAHVKNPRPMLPGDLCFFEGPHPGHVAVYVGGGRVVHAPHTGTRVQYAALAGLSSALGFTGSARYWHPGQKSVGDGGGPGRGATSKRIHTEQAELAGLVQGLGRGVTVAAAEGVAHVDLPRATQHRLKEMIKKIRELWRQAWKDGVVTPAELDQITAQTNAALKLYAAAVKATAAKLKREIAAAEKAVAAAKDNFETQWSKLQDRVLTAFDRQTEARLKKIRASVAGFGFDIGEGEETPSERLLREREQARNAQEIQQRIADAQAALAAAQASGDQQAIADAQKELNDALYDQQTDALQKQADAEREAADKALAAAQQDYQDQRDLQRQALQDQLDDLEKWLESRQITYEEAAALLAAMFAGDGDEIGAAFLAALLAQLDRVGDAFKILGISAQALQELFGDIVPANQSARDWLWNILHGGQGGSGSGVGGGGGVGGGIGGGIGHAPGLKDGGIVMSPMQLGEDGEEAVLPLTDPRASRWLARVMAELGQRGGGTQINVVLPGAMLLGRDRDAARRIASAAAPEIRRQIGYRNSNLS